MNQQVFLCNLIQRDDFRVQAIQPNTLVAVFAKDHWLTAFQFQHIVEAVLGVGGVAPGAVVEDDAVLVDFHKGGSLVFRRSFEYFSHVLHVAVNGASHKGGFRPNGYRKRIEGLLDRPHRR